MFTDVSEESRRLTSSSAICLSSLRAPSPPEPAQLHDEKDTVVDDAAIAPPTSELEEQEVFRLKDCGHEFHAECLVSWTVLRKKNCPICRTVYYHEEPEKPTDIEAQATDVAQSGPVAAAAITAAPVQSNALNWHYFWHGRDGRQTRPEARLQDS